MQKNANFVFQNELIKEQSCPLMLDLVAAYVTLGCKLNFAETSSLGDKLLQHGVRRAVKGQKADICVLNTCTVTETSNHKCRQAIHRMVRQHPNALIVVMGCYAQLYAREIACMQGVDVVISMEHKANAVDIILSAYTERARRLKAAKDGALISRDASSVFHAATSASQAPSSVFRPNMGCSEEVFNGFHAAMSGSQDSSSACHSAVGGAQEASSGPHDAAGGSQELSATSDDAATNKALNKDQSHASTGGMHIDDGMADISLHHYEDVEVHDIRSFVPSCSRGERTRFFLKVQDGCDYFCTYCAIPLARGRSRNGSIESLVEQARDAVAQGGKEIVITGVNIGDFGKSTGENFFDLLVALDNVDGIERYRISSIEPNLLTEQIIDFCAASKHLMPHFHIPLQSGSDAVLRLMHRRYGTELFASRIEYIKKVMPHAFIGVDIIVGTRGETDELFEESYNFARSIDVSQYHVFSYSERPGTAALRIPYAVDERVKHERSRRLIELSETKRIAFYKSQIGQIRPVLTERAHRGYAARGFTDNYVRVDVPLSAGAQPQNSIVNYRLTSLSSDNSALMGEPIVI